jgi:hypothetical protein
MKVKSNIAELAEFFPSSGSTRVSRSSSPVKVTAVSSRYWLPGDTYQQALARQQAAMAKLEAKIAAKMTA